MCPCLMYTLHISKVDLRFAYACDQFSHTALPLDLVTMREASIFESFASSKTLSDLCLFLRKGCIASVDSNYEEHGKIGDTGVMVKVDECKIGRGKYLMGWMVESLWIIGMIQRGEKRERIKICPIMSERPLPSYLRLRVI